MTQRFVSASKYQPVGGGVATQKILNFLDAYFEYNQISIYKNAFTHVTLIINIKPVE